MFRKKGAWEVDHSLPRARGGADHLNNYYPACISCNRSKGAHTTKTARGWHGRNRAPLSSEKLQRVKTSNTIIGIIFGGIAGGLIGGKKGLGIGAAAGGLIGYNTDPEE